jgi:hypothetical protein
MLHKPNYISIVVFFWIRRFYMDLGYKEDLLLVFTQALL